MPKLLKNIRTGKDGVVYTVSEARDLMLKIRTELIKRGEW